MVMCSHWGLPQTVPGFTLDMESIGLGQLGQIAYGVCFKACHCTEYYLL